MAKKQERIEVINYKQENKQLMQQLTKRNEQYMFELDKALVAASVSEIERDTIKNTMMIELIESQKKGITARQLYGTVAERVKIILLGPQEDYSKPSPDWQLLIDGGLLLGSVFMIIVGLNPSQPYGIIGLLLNYLFAGFAMLMITKSSPRYIGQVTFKNRKLFMKYILFTILGMLTWMGGMIAIGLLAGSFDIVLPSIYYIVIGVITILLRFYLKKVWKIRGTVF